MLEKWWTYQKERFPVLGHGLLILAFSFSAISYSAMLRGSFPTFPAAAVAFVTAFLFFLQLRIADEFKDFEEDSRYRPYRAVPRGLVSLGELGVVGAVGAAIQFVLGFLLSPSLVLLLLVVWVYLALMTQEFFVREWLKNKPITYMVSHMLIMPQIDFYATACDWWPLTHEPPNGLGWFLAVSFFNGIVIEIGRKVRAPKDEETGVNTYSHLWGPRNATLAWLGAMATTAVCAVMASTEIAFVVPVCVLLGVLLVSAVAVARRFLMAPDTGRAKAIETMAGIWTLCMYLGLGAIPLAWRWFQTG